MRGLLIAASLILAGPMALAAPAEYSSVIKGADGAELGTVDLKEGPLGVLVHFDLHGLKPGWHGVHFHAKGDCSDPKFLNSGAHVEAEGEKLAHGFLNPQGTHAADLPNVFAAADGTVHADTFSTFVSLHGEKQRPALLGGAGTALVVHENPDDYTNPPIGGAGARIACAVLK
ncbi:superoxide dismutase family protein [Beijerinckia indica]|uniref:Superoxide dismutase copper/zinc binding n=1 Tax=Beijerinckia indica subsp. indica (strain ATCC 9039 / DSM 1715 / NCIMB 8712) TaxID=395963 RepID=B2IBA9_BEII9|nr:superoxide dismutase family protein [Beijerinckia indica]ACB95193.1 superoxide dismutase copper/zinc binding [Beijerinckia indica subsp. indica ATCC 9039]